MKIGEHTEDRSIRKEDILEESVQEKSSPEKSSPDRTIQERIQILAVDTMRDFPVLRNIFANIGNVLCTSSGEHALYLLEHSRVDIVLLNNVTTDLDAVHILHYIKLNRNFDRLPILILYSDMNSAFIRKCLDYGVMEFIRKPFMEDILRNRVFRVMAHEKLKHTLEYHISVEHRIIERHEVENKTLVKEMALALSKTIDAKDRYTSGHSERVANYSRMIAEDAGLSSEDVDKIYYMGLLHDVGKIGVPSRIINSTEKLTDEEFRIIKSHTVIGASILQGIDIFPELAIGAHYHHERFDGRGYPQGLRGTTIPELARMISVADAYDAMTSTRSYRRALDQEFVYDQLRNGRNAQFDPDYAEIMLHIMQKDTDYQLRDTNTTLFSA